MKFLGAQLSYFFGERQVRRNIRALVHYLLFLTGLVALFSVLFHLIMVVIEGKDHSWLTGVYWTLTVMSTLGFGDITFTSDVGRFFSIVVLLSGIVFLVIMLPFAFIRYFYAPWLEARIRTQAPREVPVGMRGHVIICRRDSIVPGLARRLAAHGIPYVVLEPDPVVAAQMMGEGLWVLTGEIDNRITYERAAAETARLVFANTTDTVNTNITLTVREVDARVPIAALAESDDSVDILELSGATAVLPLKRKLGEQLANRVVAPHGRAHVIGNIHGLVIAEYAPHRGELAGRTIRESRLRETTGTSIVAVWERGRLIPASGDHRLTETSVPVVVGTPEQMARLNALSEATPAEREPVVVIGGGKVGCAATAALRAAGVAVHLIERDERVARRGLADRTVVGDAADRDTLMEAGLGHAPAVLLTTNDDDMNIYLSIYCRRLNPSLRIVSRITHSRNLEAIHRAGADFVLSYASVSVETIFSLLHGREPVVLGGDVDYFLIRVPESLDGRSLAESGIGARTGLVVIAIEDGEGTTTDLSGSTRLSRSSSLLALGTEEQRQAFAEIYGFEAETQ
jgi:Trk K+ transport system NAD-binding subunit